MIWLDAWVSTHACLGAVASSYTSRNGCSCHGVDAINGEREDRGISEVRTARKARATLTVLWESSPSGGDDLTLSAGPVKGWFVATLCPSKGWWHQHFEKGICTWMRDVVSQDWAYTITVLLALLEVFEEEWQMFYLWIPLVSICACVFLLVSSLGGMRGFEVVWTDLAALRHDLAYCEAAEDDSAVSWLIVGRFNRLGVMVPYMEPLYFWASCKCIDFSEICALKELDS